MTNTTQELKACRTQAIDDCVEAVKGVDTGESNLLYEFMRELVIDKLEALKEPEK